MEVDLETAPPGTEYTADVCIAGAGIAGLILADALIGSGFRVALLEGGGKTLEARSQDLYQAEIIGHPHQGAKEGRFRSFGGSSTRWGGQLLSYTDDVFSPPASTGMSAWPIGNCELNPYYSRALRLMEVPDDLFATDALSDTEATGVRRRYSRWASFRNRNLAGTAGRRCLESDNVTVYLHANVTRLEAEADRVRTAHAANYSGGAFKFSAQHFAVCLGTIECSRLLLVSQIGNAAGQVGRYFHDHIGVHAATLKGETRSVAARYFLPKLHRGCLYTTKLEATAGWREQHAATSVMAHFPIVEAEDSPVATLRMLLQSLQRKQLALGLPRKLFALPAQSLDLVYLAYATRIKKMRPLSKHAELRLNIDVEQKPQADSRITLSSDKDPLEIPRACLDWKIGAEEKRSVRLFARTIQAALNQLHLGTVEIRSELMTEDHDLTSIMSDTYHMMGGTRMGKSKTDSVVDQDLRVHDFSNLYIASCSVFPTGGSSNPTFTLMALSLRLAERLRNRLSR